MVTKGGAVQGPFPAYVLKQSLQCGKWKALRIAGQGTGEHGGVCDGGQQNVGAGIAASIYLWCLLR